MVPVKRYFLLSVATTIILIIVAGCGGGSKVTFPTPQGTFSNANLNGPFAFSYTGSDAGGFLAVAGSFVAMALVISHPAPRTLIAKPR